MYYYVRLPAAMVFYSFEVPGFEQSQDWLAGRPSNLLLPLGPDLSPSSDVDAGSLWPQNYSLSVAAVSSRLGRGAILHRPLAPRRRRQTGLHEVNIARAQRVGAGAVAAGRRAQVCNVLQAPGERGRVLTRARYRLSGECEPGSPTYYRFPINKKTW